MTETADAVVIGAGHNGLVAANLLADAGWDVVVLEATAHIGGAVRSAAVTAPGFVNDLFSAFYPLAAGSPVLRDLDLEAHGLRWAHSPTVLAHALPDGRAALISRELDLTAESLEAFAPGDGQRWVDAYREWHRVSDPVRRAILTPFPPVRAGADLLRHGGVAGALRLARRFVLPARRLGQELFRGGGAQVLLAGLALHTDLGPEQAASGGYGYLLAMLAQEFGFPAPVGGAGALVDALASRLAGRIVTSARVERVIVRNGTALGVSTGDGRHWRARKAVLADVPAPALYRHLVGAGHLPATLMRDLDAFQWDNATLKIDWALNGPVPWTAPGVAGAGTVHLGGFPDDLARYAFELGLGRTPETPFLLAGQMTTTDATRSPAGTETLWAYTHLPRGTQVGEKDVDRVEDVIEAHAPGFRDLVAGRHVARPVDLAAANPSLDDGALNGGTAAVHQQLFFRPVPGLGRADTPIDRLYLAGSSAHPGGGVHGAPGANAARAALARHRPVLGDLYFSGVRAAHRLVHPQ
jgi:phytoene dehydrogenase-like protein